MKNRDKKTCHLHQNQQKQQTNKQKKYREQNLFTGQSQVSTKTFLFPPDFEMIIFI